MDNNKIFFGIIIGAVIIGGCIYYGLKDDKQVGGMSDIPQIQPDKSPAGHFDGPVTISPSASLGGCGADNNTIVTKVIDGDTVVVKGGWHVRLLGMDADEKGYPCYDTAKTRLEDLVLSKNVLLEKDKTDVDQYGRCLRYIFINNINVDAQLVKEGLAVARFYSPDVKYRAEISEVEQYAQQNKIGCKWSGQ
ncbi:MAG: thermonuclease family protein [Candidatus Staskawiczbacteria bacterium]|nr:thermonuclease family protein [Candidatus Staskawiczbacteria bacterium]